MLLIYTKIFSSAVPCGIGAFQMSTSCIMKIVYVTFLAKLINYQPLWPVGIGGNVWHGDYH